MNLFAGLRKENGAWLDLLLLTGLWGVMTWIANPIGDFPLNDDWTYGVSVRALVDEGRIFFLTDWACKTLVAHVLWGALFCLPFGFSYTALRFSQLSAGLLGVFGVYWLCLELGSSRRTALICSLSLLVNPLYFQLSNTFMTDVAFTAFCTLALLLLFKGMLKNRLIFSAIGWIVVGFSIWVRELTLMIPAGYAALQVYRSGFGFKTLIRAALPGVVFFALLIVHQKVMVPLFGFPNLDNGRSNSALHQLAKNPLKFTLDMIHRSTDLLIYVGLFSLPIALWFKQNIMQSATELEKKIVKYVSISFLVVAVGSLALQGKIMPLGKNGLFDFGLGPATLRDVYLLKIPNLPVAPTWIWMIVTIAGLWGAIEILKYLVISLMRLWERDSAKRNDSRLGILVFLISMTLLYSAAIIASGFYDRYLLIYLPILAAIAVILGGGFVVLSRAGFVGVASLLSVFALFGALATHDYLSWNRVRWEIVRDLNGDQGISPKRIDGGYEVNGELNFAPEKTLDPNKSWWWVDDNEYVISFGAMPGYEIIESRVFSNYLYRDDSAIYVLKRAQ